MSLHGTTRSVLCPCADTASFHIRSDKAEAALESIRSSGEPGAIVIGAIKDGQGVEMQNLEAWSS